MGVSPMYSLGLMPHVKLFLFLITILLALPGRAAPPHIVLFISDDHSCSDCAPYGATDVRTPNLAKLAADGMRFDAAFAASPTCTPSRSAIYSGLYPFRNGAHANHSLVNDDVRTLPHYFNELGYRVVIAGKTHIGPRERFPFEYLQGSNVMPPGKNHVLWTDLNTSAIDGLLGGHDHKQPLLLVVCSHSPHVYWPENDGYDPAALKLPPDLLDTPQTRAARCRYYTDVTHMDEQLGEVRDSLAKHGYADALFIYTSDNGAQWPFEKWNLYEGGIHAPLIVAWSGKIKPRTSTDALVSLIDLLPTLLEASGASAPAGLDGRSFLPVLLGKSVHREEVFATHTGDGNMNRSPMRCIRTTRYKYILNLAPQTPFETHISKAAGPDGLDYWESWLKLAESDPRAAKLIDRFHHRPAEELYDITADPTEEHNLATDPAHEHGLSDLRDRVKKWRIQQGENLDKIPLPEDARQGQIPYAD